MSDAPHDEAPSRSGQRLAHDAADEGDAEAHHTRFEQGARVRRIMPLGIAASALFSVYDVAFVYLVRPASSLRALLALRAVQVTVLALVAALAPVRNEREVRRTLWLALWAVAPLFASMSVPTGGLGSLYGFGHAFFAIGGSIVGLPRRQMFWMQLGAWCAYPLTLALWSLPLPWLRAQWFDPAPRGVLLTVLGFLAGVGLLGVELSHLLYSLRREIFESKRVGRYVLRKRIGRGGMGEVWSAWHVGLKREVAVKFLHAQLADAATRRRFEREARATAALEHPHTVRVYDAGVSDDGQPFYAMELLAGRSLRQLVDERGPLSPYRAARLVAQAARALAEAHERGVVHRDLKPENVFVCAPGGDESAKLLDFGIARLLDASDASLQLSSTGVLAGTPAYMAPEVVQGEPAEAAADVYALGGTLYFALTGAPPFVAEHPSGVLYAHVHTPARAPSAQPGNASPEPLDALVLRCLAKRPDERVASARELARLLTELAPSLAKLPAAPPPARAPSARAG